MSNLEKKLEEIEKTLAKLISTVDSLCAVYVEDQGFKHDLIGSIMTRYTKTVPGSKILMSEVSMVVMKMLSLRGTAFISPLEMGKILCSKYKPETIEGEAYFKDMAWIQDEELDPIVKEVTGKFALLMSLKKE